jgi:hypothetical protein
MQSILANIKDIRQLLEHNEAQDDLMHVWDRICFRLDIMALVVTQILNGGLVCLWLTDT